MAPTLRLDEIRRQQFADTVEAAMAVQSRQQFFVWTQSAVQALVPHEILLCCVHDGCSLNVRHFSASRYFQQAHFDAVAHPVRGLPAALIQAADAADDGIVVVAEDGGGQTPEALASLVAGNELKNLVSRVVSDSRGQVDALYAFARVDHSFDATLRHAMLVLTPHLHEAYLRVLQFERLATPVAVVPRELPLVTQRQQEILRLIQHGKTNSEIAAQLSCSQWTVKNHIQNILRRLDTNTRAHALARAMSLGILRPE